MIKIQLLRISIALIFVLSLVTCTSDFPSNQNVEEIETSDKLQNIKGAFEDDFDAMKNPITGDVQPHILFETYNYAKNLQRISNNKDRAGDLELHEVRWQSHGPNDIGGRTRAIHIDNSDSERKKVWVGGVSGGLWVTEDISKANPDWRVVDDFWQSLAISSITQDPNNNDILYVGTGELYQSFFVGPGVGMFRSIDGGESWELMPSTTSSRFSYIEEIAVKENGEIYVGTGQRGLFRSKDNGATFQNVLAGSDRNRIFDIELIGEELFVSTGGSLYRSTEGDFGSWDDIGVGRPNFPTNLVRVEIAVCPADPNMIYVVGSLGNGTESNLFFTSDGGTIWIEKFFGGVSGFAGNQGWYDLEIAVNPFNCDELYAGGVGLVGSSNRGTTWQPRFQGAIHVDHHIHIFDDQTPGVVYFGNDGGIWQSPNGGISVQNKNLNYITTQFYACSIHPDPGTHYYVGGTQDNSSFNVQSDTPGPAFFMNGGDGVFCFIDQNEPNIQIVSSQNGNYRAYLNGVPGPSITASARGSFIHESDYDDDSNILYGQTNYQGDYFRWKINEDKIDSVDISGLNIGIQSVLVDPTTDNQVYFGTGNSQLVKVENAHDGVVVNGEILYNFPGSNTVSSIYKDALSADDILVTFSNFGLSNNVYISNDGGISFTGIEGNLPNVPVWWAMFDPANHDRAIIGTQVGLWTTEIIDGEKTIWTPSSEIPLVPIRMLQIRDSDKSVLAATYGRGLFTSNLFASPAAVIKLPSVVYLDQPFTADASSSVLASSYEWDFGDGTQSVEEILQHSYDKLGRYQVTLTINGELSTTKEITVLPIRPLPYSETHPEYGGGFEANEFDFAAFSDKGSVFEKGNSTITGKNGTANGANAYVLGINEPEYAPNTVAYLYTPGFNFSDNTLYTLRFESRYLIQNAFDGFKLEYSSDFGTTWRQLGDKSDPGWYNYLNQNIARGVFDQGESYFTNIVPSFQEFSLDVSEFAGEEFVSFRFVFKSDEEDQNVGAAIDVFRIDKFDGTPQTEIVNQNAEYTAESEMTISWTSIPEYQAEKYEIERSTNGFDYEVIKTINATGITTLDQQSYTSSYSELRPLLFFRIHSINKNDNIGYAYDFYSPTMVVTRNVEEDVVHKIFPNPFTDAINVTFTSIIEEEVKVQLFNTAGQLIDEQTGAPGDVFLRFENLNLPGGLYLLNIQIGDEEDKTYKLFSGAN